ncbi:MAG TPA: hypothetical protein VJY62_08920 [Bacteroidia bacterium]|nr:hypothetical protein [Bacteroidia bacterium]
MFYSLLTILTFDTDTFIKIASFILTLAGTVLSTIYKLLPDYERNRKKTDLKTDLEILSKLKPEDQGYQIIQEHIQEKIKQAYPQAAVEKNEKKLIINDILWRLYGGLMAVGLGYWTYSLYRNHNGFTVWMLLTGIYAFAGLVLLFFGYKKNRVTAPGGPNIEN